MKTEICFGEKVKLHKFSMESEKVSEIGGIWNRGKCIIASGGWTPLLITICYQCAKSNALNFMEGEVLAVFFKREGSLLPEYLQGGCSRLMDQRPVRLHWALESVEDRDCQCGYSVGYRYLGMGNYGDHCGGGCCDHQTGFVIVVCVWTCYQIF